MDPLNQRAEFLEGNNTHADFVVGVGYRADFVVKAVKGPAALRPGQDFVARVTVCNQGNTPDSADVALVLSDDALIQPSTAPGAPGDVIVGWVPVSTLGPNQCATVPMTGNSPSLQGLYHLGAFVDVLNQRPELRDDNNTHPGYRLGVGNGADFTVQTVTGPGGVEPGQLLTAQVKVCNQGTDAGMAEVMLLLSSDATVQWGGGPWGDLVIGVAPVGLLFPGHCVTVPVSGNASLPYPGHEGAYHLGAAALASQGTDLNPENDLHSGYRLGVGHRPDFTVTDVKAPPSVESGQGFLAQATVCNQGTQPEATEVRLFLSDVAPIVANPGPWQGGVSVGAANLLPLMPGQCVTVQVPATWSQPYTLPEGAYHLVAVVDPGNHRAELIEDNNAHADFVLGVGHRADFIVKAVQAPASVQPGQSLTAQVTVCNQGTLSDSADVALFLASEPFSRPAPGEEMLVTYLGQAPVGFLAPGRCATVPMTGTATLPPPGSPGAYYLGALVDFSNQRPELIEDNNAHPGAVLGVGSEPDFVVTDVKGPSSVEVGQPLTAQVTVCNQGTQPDDVQVALVLSTDDVIRPEGPGPVPGEDRPVGGASVGHLLPGQCATVPVSGNAYPPPPGDEGAYFLGAFVDPGYQRFELREDNNAHAGHMLGVGHGPDFVVTDVKGPPSTQTPHPFTAQVTVCNQGTQPGDAALALVLSADSVIRPQKAPGVGEDPVVGGALTGPLYPGRCATVPVSGNASVPSPGTGSAFHLGAFVDPEDQRPELIEDNNTHPGYVLGVGNGADFIVTAVKGPASVQSGQPFTAQVTVCNQGTLPDTTDVVLFLSRDGALPPASGPGGSPIGGAPVNFTLPGQCLTVPVSTSVSVPASGPEGAYHLGAVVDPGNQRTELLETNNSHPGYVLGVGYRADFIVSDVKAPASVQPGQPLTAQVTVCNQGTRPDSTQVVLMLSADATLVPPTVPGSTADTVVGSASVGLLSPGQCATVPVTGPANPPSPGAGSAYFLGAFVDPGYQRFELREDN
ncbi:CARDB domain-containing protein, partial [Pyxidicoccus sp. 3LFB2]